MSFNIPTQTLGHIFQSQYPFVVPKYQRGYAWEQEEVADFLKDIHALSTSTAKNPAHFMGGLVHVQFPAANSVSRSHEIVDGQQRMATFTLLMAAISHGLDALSKENQTKASRANCEAHKEALDESFLKYKEIENAKRIYKPKMTMSKVDQDFFAEVVDGQSPVPTRETHNRIYATYKKFQTELVNPILNSTSTVKVRLKKFNELSKLVADNLLVIHMVSQSRSEAYRLFSVLNDRGRNLSDGDLLRARTLELTEMDSSIQSKVELKWDQILDGSEDDIEKFLRAYFPSTLGKRAPSKGLFDAFEDSYLRNKKPQEVYDFVVQLSNEKIKYQKIRLGEWPFLATSSKASNWDIDRLYRLVNILRHESAHPLLLSATHLGENKFIEILRMLDIFVFRYINIVGAHPSPIYAPYYTESVEMRKSPSKYSTSRTRATLKNLISTRASDQLFRETLISKLHYSDDSAKNRIIKHFFTTIESYYSSILNGKLGTKLKPDLMTVFDLASTSIEHIYPQKAPAKTKNNSLELLISKLGNLTILAPSDNSDLGNEPFSVKKSAFQKSSIALNRELSKIPKWDDKALLKRENDICDLAIKIYSL